MYYLDTSILVSYVFTTEKKHPQARQLLDKLSPKGLYTSPLTLAELYNTICRKIAGGELKLAPPFNTYLQLYGRNNIEARLRLLASTVTSLLTEKLGLKIVDTKIVDTPENYKPAHILGVKVPLVYKKAIELSPQLRIRTKDLLHIAYALLLRDKYNIHYIVTSDAQDYNKVKNQLQRLGIKTVILDDSPSNMHT